MQVRKRRRLLVFDMAPAFQLARSAAGDEDRQIHMIVHVRISHAAAVQESE